MKAGWVIPFIIGGALQLAGAAMNGQPKQALVNPYLALAVSFALITFLFTALFFLMPHPLPTIANLASMPWWAPIGGLVGALQLYMGLTQVNKVGAGLFMGVTVTPALIASLLIDHFGPAPYGRSPDLILTCPGGGTAGLRGRAHLKVLKLTLHLALRSIFALSVTTMRGLAYGLHLGPARIQQLGRFVARRLQTISAVNDKTGIQVSSASKTAEDDKRPVKDSGVLSSHDLLGSAESFDQGRKSCGLVSCG